MFKFNYIKQIINTRSDLWGISSVGFSGKHVFFELGGTWNGDLEDSDHIWTYVFGAELSGGVPGAGEGMEQYNLLEI